MKRELSLAGVSEPLAHYDRRLALSVRLSGIDDMTEVDENGKSVQGRLQLVLNGTATDIRDCSALCEKYMQKRFLGQSNFHTQHRYSCRSASETLRRSAMGAPISGLRRDLRPAQAGHLFCAHYPGRPWTRDS